MNVSKITFIMLIIGLSAVYLFSGCEASFNPVNEEKGSYSIYGSLNIDRQKNYIRVKNLNIPFSRDTISQLDATVKLKDLTRGNTETLRETVIKTAGVKIHTFIAEMAIRPETEYVATVQDANGREVSAQTRTPVVSQKITLQPQQLGCRENFEIVFEPVNPDELIQLKISFGEQLDTNAYVFFEAKGRGQTQAFISLRPYDVVRVNFQFPPPRENDCEQIDTNFLTMVYTHYGFRPGTSTTSDSINVPGGTGEFLGFYRDTLTFELDIQN